MKLVTFSEAVAPHGAGDTRLVSDDVAVALARDGVISASDPWPPAESSPAGVKMPVRPVLRPTRPAGKPADRRIAR